MAIDDDLAERLRLAMARHIGVSERRMFGGLCFMLDGHMVCGTHENRFMFRVGKINQEEALARPGARAMDFTGRPMGGFVWVDPDNCRGSVLDGWIDLAVSYVVTLPTKVPKPATKTSR